jgi:hypothetical protein
MVVAVSLALGLAASAVSYLTSSLAIGPAVRADTEELRERGAKTYFESCAGFAEPRFWPECIGDAEEKRTRGASELVLFCTGEDRFNRFFGPEDCLAEERPLLALTGGPRREDAVVGGIVAALSLAVLGVLTFLYKLVRPSGSARQSGQGSPRTSGSSSPDASGAPHGTDAP